MHNEAEMSVGEGSVRRSKVLFKAKGLYSQFYSKLALVPIVFIVIRLWGSLRVVLHAVDSPASRNGTLQLLQAFFDPSQGLFNCVLFVLASRSDRERMFALLAPALRVLSCGFLQLPPAKTEATGAMSSLSSTNSLQSKGAERDRTAKAWVRSLIHSSSSNRSLAESFLLDEEEKEEEEEEEGIFIETDVDTSTRDGDPDGINGIGAVPGLDLT
jgi:hypothetical protein